MIYEKSGDWYKWSDIWGNKTAIFVWSKPYYAIMINQKEITQSNRAHFEYVWKSAKLPSEKDRKGRTILARALRGNSLFSDKNVNFSS